MLPRYIVSLIIVLAIFGRNLAAEPTSIWEHLREGKDVREVRNLTASWEMRADAPILKLVVKDRPRYAWAVIPPPPNGWHLQDRAAVKAEIANTGSEPANILLWVVGDRGWDAVPSHAVLKPGESQSMACLLQETYPDGTPKIDPKYIKQIQVMLLKTNSPPDQRQALATKPAEHQETKPNSSQTGASASYPSHHTEIEVRSLVADGIAQVWQKPAGRLEVPKVEMALPSAGRRVQYRIEDDKDSGIYSVLYLPEDWKPNTEFPVIVEFPGNIFFTPECYSTGLPDQCVIGYGMTKGMGSICIGLPFVDRQAGGIAESGWGNADETCHYALNVVEEICSKFGGDRQNIVLTGFSRGALACGYIGLRNDEIATLWKGFHACQHYDGDGWQGATLEGAIARAQRFRGQAVFQTDNHQEKFQSVMDAMRTQVTWAKSGLNAHATAMFLDDRPSTQLLRQWYSDLVNR